MPAVTVLYIPCPSLREAAKISQALLEGRLIACANIVESSSIYNWKGKRENAKEHIIFAKTTPKKAKKAERLAKRLHSYEIPAILSFRAGANSEYVKWVATETE